MPRTQIYSHSSNRWRTLSLKRLSLALAIFTIALLASTQPAIAAESGPSILVILADNWAWPHASILGDRVIKTPTFDRVAREGVLFTHAFCTSPSCSPSRAALLTGKVTHQLEDGGNLWGILPARHVTYPDLLREAGYTVGFMGKGWGPGSLEGSGRQINPAGPAFKSFDEFLKTVPADRPFCFWMGLRDPHRSYVRGSGAQSGMKLDQIEVPAYLPDVPEVRSDIADYYFAVQRFDRDAGDALKLLESVNRQSNTLVLIAGDNGWQMPRGLSNVYDAGTRVPLAIRWPGKIPPGRTLNDFVDFTDLAPTFLEAAGLPAPHDMTGKSLLGLMHGETAKGRDRVFLEHERHANVRRGDLSYPARAVRNREFLYVRNFRPDLWPVGDPELYKAVGSFGDLDASPTKEFLLAHRDDPKFAKYTRLALEKRSAEELYDLSKDPHQTENVADVPQHVVTRQKLRAELDHWMSETADPRAVNANDDRWDRYPYFGPIKKPEPPK